mmetsp:Transcript_45401/g.112782  ORF Transcript_45401/g.112782 Transcript_45401/m.112782 type:complete len:253 (-) Transcript_45401:1243-2001(-)
MNERSDGGMDNKHKQTQLLAPPLGLRSPLLCDSLSHKCAHTFRHTYTQLPPSLFDCSHTQRPPHHITHALLLNCGHAMQSKAIPSLSMASLTHSLIAHRYLRAVFQCILDGRDGSHGHGARHHAAARVPGHLPRQAGRTDDAQQHTHTQISFQRIHGFEGFEALCAVYDVAVHVVQQLAARRELGESFERLEAPRTVRPPLLDPRSELCDVQVGGCGQVVVLRQLPRTTRGGDAAILHMQKDVVIVERSQRE